MLKKILFTNVSLHKCPSVLAPCSKLKGIVDERGVGTYHSLVRCIYQKYLGRYQLYLFMNKRLQLRLIFCSIPPSSVKISSNSRFKKAGKWCKGSQTHKLFFSTKNTWRFNNPSTKPVKCIKKKQDCNNILQRAFHH